MADTCEICGHKAVVTRKRQKNTYLRISDDGTLRISCPLRTPAAEIERFVSGHSEWIDARLEEIAERARASRPGRTLLWGESAEISVTHGTPNAVRYEDGKLVISAPESVTEREIAALTESFKRGALLSAIRALVAKWEPLLGVESGSIRIRVMKSRWGSCNTLTGALCFNSRLVEKDPRCLEYVVVHELCHLLEPNHSPAFWAHVARCLPDWKSLRKLTHS